MARGGTARRAHEERCTPWSATGPTTGSAVRRAGGVAAEWVALGERNTMSRGGASEGDVRNAHSARRGSAVCVSLHLVRLSISRTSG